MQIQTCHIPHCASYQHLRVFLSIWKGLILLMHINHQDFTVKVNLIWNNVLRMNKAPLNTSKTKSRTFPLCTARPRLGAFISIFVLLAFSTSGVCVAVCNYCTALTTLSTVRFLKQPCGFSLLWKRHTGNLPVYCWLRLLCFQWFTCLDNSPTFPFYSNATLVAECAGLLSVFSLL